MPTCTQAAPLTQRAMVSQGPALFVLGGGQLLRGRRLLDELAALSGVSGLWWRHVGGIAPKGAASPELAAIPPFPNAWYVALCVI